jgi:hypothetical protein
MQRLDAKPPQWRSLFAPGGCEFFEIKIPAYDFVLQIGIGNPYSETYRRRDRRYRRRPTRNAPALPAEFPFALLRYRGRTTLLDLPGTSLQCDDTPTLQLGPAKITWGNLRVSWSWNDNPPFSFQAETSPGISTTMTPDGAICEISSLRVLSAPFLNAQGTISHVISAHLTAEFAAHYLRSISQL